MCKSVKTYIREKGEENLCIVYAFSMAWNVVKRLWWEDEESMKGGGKLLFEEGLIGAFSDLTLGW